MTATYQCAEHTGHTADEPYLTHTLSPHPYVRTYIHTYIHRYIHAYHTHAYIATPTE